MIGKAALALLTALLVIPPAQAALDPDQASDITRAVSFSGGGWSTHTASSGWLSGLLAAGQQGLVPTATLGSIFAEQDLIGGISGGSWFLTMLAYSPAFASSLEAAPDVDDWFGPNGYMGAQTQTFEALMPKVKTNLQALLQAVCPSYISAANCQLTSAAIVEVMFQYDKGLLAPGLIFLASLWDGDLAKGPTWEAAVRIVYNYREQLANFRATAFVGADRVAFLGNQDIVIAGAMGTAIEVLNDAGAGNLFQTNNLSVYRASTDQPAIKGPIPIALVDPGVTRDGTARPAVNFLPSGAKALRYYSDSTGIELQQSLPAQVNIDGISIFDAGMISSAAAAAVSSETLVLEVARHLIESALTQANLSSSMPSSNELAQTLFAPFSVFMRRAAIGARVDTENRLVVGDLDANADISQLSDERALRLYDGGYVDNLAAAYVLKQIQVAHNPDDFVLTLFQNGGMGDAAATAELLAQIGDSAGQVLPLSTDVLNLFGRPDYLNPGTTVPLSMFGLSITTSSPAIFDARAWKDAAPVWVYQPSEDFQLIYYQLQVQTIDNPHFKIAGGHRGTLHLFINQDAKTSAAPFTERIAEEYRNLFASTREGVLEEGYQHLAKALNADWVDWDDIPPISLQPNPSGLESDLTERWRNWWHSSRPRWD